MVDKERLRNKRNERNKRKPYIFRLFRSFRLFRNLSSFSYWTKGMVISDCCPLAVLALVRN